MSPSKADERPKLSSIHNLLANNSLAAGRSGLSHEARRDSAKHEAERNPESESGGSKHLLFGPPDLKIRYSDNVAMRCRAPRPTVLCRGYRKPLFAGGTDGGDGGAFAAGADSLPFSRAASTLSRTLSGGCNIPLPETSCAASTV